MNTYRIGEHPAIRIHHLSLLNPGGGGGGREREGKQFDYPTLTRKTNKILLGKDTLSPLRLC